MFLKLVKMINNTEDFILVEDESSNSTEYLLEINNFDNESILNTIFNPNVLKAIDFLSSRVVYDKEICNYLTNRVDFFERIIMFYKNERVNRNSEQYEAEKIYSFKFLSSFVILLENVTQLCDHDILRDKFSDSFVERLYELIDLLNRKRVNKATIKCMKKIVKNILNRTEHDTQIISKSCSFSFI